MIYNPSTYGKGRVYLKKLEDAGERYELRKIKDKRSNPQNRYFHLLCGYFSQETGYELRDVKRLIKTIVCPDIFTQTKILTTLNGPQTFLGEEKSTAELDVSEMTKVIDRFRRWASEEVGIYLPMADGVPDELLMDAMENELHND